ncbi:hypothetical protein [Microbacterium sp. ZXX196]|uniref:hypothetical protein n=1 Tax=Microbacterium sp. ZXX196 TaxID=2609291 RepID=UPI0012B8DD39|nr:hypothetical protein [Microbacterium sp. ZXX196]MTE24846.1 hypothetical protein [Microbacterium sp. ZXX196]
MSAADALAYVDKAIDNVADLDPDLSWANAEVLEVLEDVRSLILTGKPLPGLFLAPDHEAGGEQ